VEETTLHLREALLNVSAVHSNDYITDSRDFSVAAQGRIFFVRKKQLIPRWKNS
jgi:hypothetical protein